MAQQGPFLLVTTLRNPAQFAAQTTFFTGQFVPQIPHNLNVIPHPVGWPVWGPYLFSWEVGGCGGFRVETTNTSSINTTYTEL